MTDDPQDHAEALDEDVIDTVDDLTGDEYGEGLPDYPPSRPVGVNTVGVTAVEEDAGESFAERTSREEPETGLDQPDYPPSRPDAVGDDPSGDVGQLVDADATTQDREEQAVADAVPEVEESAEEAAMHVIEDGPD
jgi:hypothetical protein